MKTGSLRFTFSCQRCASVLEGREELSGRTGRCPTCGAIFVIPQVDTQTGLAAGPARVADDGQLPTPMHAYATAGEKAPRIRTLSGGQSAIVCPRCGRDMPVDANSCGACGLPFTMEGATAVVHASEGSNGWATAALTVGVLSIFTFCFPVAALAAIGLGFAALRKSRHCDPAFSGRSMAIAGIVFGFIGLSMFMVFAYMGRLF